GQQDKHSLETMNGMDSAGSCDSVVSANSGFSDDSLEHLSAEEKACLMFLEETIDSLDIEEDSGLSNDEPDQLPSPGNITTKLADLSASMKKPVSDQPFKKSVKSIHMQSYLVPTPLVVANCSLPHFTSKINKLTSNYNQKPATTPVPFEVNVVTPPSAKPRDCSVKTAEGPLPRGPLSYDALVHLRRNKSAKSHPEVLKSKTGPPAVAPKPKTVPANIRKKTQNEDILHSVKHATNPQLVRLEALQKLGLLKDKERESAAAATPPPTKSHSFLDPAFSSNTRGPLSCNPTRSPSFSSSQTSTKHTNRNVKGHVHFHPNYRDDQEPGSASQHPAQTSRLKTAGLERSVSLDSYTNYSEPQHIPSDKSVKTTNTTQPSDSKPTNLMGYTVMVVPGMGQDRKEALRKLGLLKD
uniref:Zgc:158258 n=1 Tax=Nothobranchius furzeri TaxID=105023 RepID=A0A8C6LJ05_NOTFU